jgi:tetratricopeptide (TPR) repeat protein
MFPKARYMAARALVLDSTLAEAHASLGLLRTYDYDWRGAEAAFRRAIALNPSYATAHQWYSSYLEAVGQLDASVAEMERARALDPLSSVISRNLGARLITLGRYDEALRQLHSTLELYPNFTGTYWYLCLVYALKQLPREAISACEREALSNRREPTTGLLAYVYAASGDRAKAVTMVRELEARSRREYVSGLQIATGYLGLGNADRMFAWLDSAYTARDPTLVASISRPLWDSVRADPRFARLRARMGLPP